MVKSIIQFGEIYKNQFEPNYALWIFPKLYFLHMDSKLDVPCMFLDCIDEMNTTVESIMNFY
jgi:hypothetical protein